MVNSLFLSLPWCQVLIMTFLPSSCCIHFSGWFLRSAQFDGEESTVKAVEAFIAREVFSRTLTNLKLHFKATHH